MTLSPAHPKLSAALLADTGRTDTLIDSECSNHIAEPNQETLERFMQAKKFKN